MKQKRKNGQGRAILEGMARTLDLGAVKSKSATLIVDIKRGRYQPAEADSKALAADWAVVGKDLKSAIKSSY